MQTQDIFIDFEALDPEQAKKLSLIDFDRLDYRSLNTLNQLYPETYARLQAESEAKREKIISDRNYRASDGYVPPRTAKKTAPDPKKPDRTRMSFNQWQDYCDRQAGIEPSHHKSYREWLNDMQNPTTDNTFKG
jgi:hypothetical protein